MNPYNPTRPYLCTSIPRKNKTCEQCDCCAFENTKDGKDLIFVKEMSITGPIFSVFILIHQLVMEEVLLLDHIQYIIKKINLLI